jgi:hypothetical protein
MTIDARMAGDLDSATEDRDLVDEALDQDVANGTVAGLVLVAIGEGILLGFDQIASPDPIWDRYRDRGYDSIRSGPRGWPRRSRSARKRRSWPSTYHRFGRFCRDFRSRSLRETKADRRHYKASVSMGFAWHPRRRRELPTSRLTSDNGRVDAPLAPVDNERLEPCQSRLEPTL